MGSYAGCRYKPGVWNIPGGGVFIFICDPYGIIYFGVSILVSVAFVSDMARCL